MAFLKYRHPNITNGIQPIADPDDINDNLDDIARVVNGNLGAENIASGVKVAATQFECGRSSVVINYNFGPPTTQWGTPYAPGTKLLYKASHALKLVAVGIVGAITTGASAWYVKNGSTVMADVLTGHSGTNIDYIVDSISSDALAVNETVSIVFTGTGTIAGVSLYFTAAHQ